MLHERIIEIKQELSSITNNPVIDTFNLDECKIIDNFYSSDVFIKKKVDNCLNHLNGLMIDFNPSYKAAYDEYIEAIIYLDIFKKFTINRIPEATTKMPDFQVTKSGDYPFDIYVEVKALAFQEGNLNYTEAQKSGLEAAIDVAQQIKSGEKVGYGETIISPTLKKGKLPSMIELIEIYIDKIRNNIKKGQYDLGETVLVVEISQLPLLGQLDENGVTIFQEDQMKSMVSGILWQTAFGRQGNLIFKPIEFEGDSNIAGALAKNGILTEYSFIKGIVFTGFNYLQKRIYYGFYRHDDQDNQATNFIMLFCDGYNDDKNTQAFRLLQK